MTSSAAQTFFVVILSEAKDPRILLVVTTNSVGKHQLLNGRTFPEDSSTTEKNTGVLRYAQNDGIKGD